MVEDEGVRQERTGHNICDILNIWSNNTHTHIYTPRERERERDKQTDRQTNNSAIMSSYLLL